MAKKNFLLGYGERLTEVIAAPPTKMEKNPPYTFDKAKSRLLPRLKAVTKQIQQLDSISCPDDRTVIAVTLHPTYTAKSYFPSDLLKKNGLESVGSKSKKITPEQTNKRSEPHEEITTELYVAGKRKQIEAITREFEDWNLSTPGAKEIVKIEDVQSIININRVKPLRSDSQHPLMEVVLHASVSTKEDIIVEGFREFMEKVGNIKVDLDRRLYAEGLCFIPVKMDRKIVDRLSEFSFLRVAREMPSVRLLSPIGRSSTISNFFVDLPNKEPLDKDIKVAIFDGGIENQDVFKNWVKVYEDSKITGPIKEFTDHGASVTSALLFGSLKENSEIETPYSHIDHYRVLDKDTGITQGSNSTQTRDEDLYDVLTRIRNVLLSKNYDFINISIGPDLPIEDDEVHGWTAVLDQLFASGTTLPVIAVGNSGEQDRLSDNARIQSPSDCVNALSIGAADKSDNDWSRASYSSFGPGRSPGIVKPDALAFGGSRKEFFWVVNPDNPKEATMTGGTSFATPLALRTGLGIRAHFGSLLSPLAIKALLIHSCEYKGHDKYESGWGRIPSDFKEIVLTEDHVARIVYQGQLSPAEWIKLPIPVPVQQMQGMVTIKATLCYFTDTDPQDTANYTKAGLEVVFRPHDDKRKKEEQMYPNSLSFFQKGILYSDKDAAKFDAHHWENTLSATRKMRGNSLKDPTFNLHYIARDGGDKTNRAVPISYACVVTVESPKTLDLYNNVVSKYRTRLEVLKPVIQIPVTT